ncbi:unnamed protein product [Moneuplotes crassus]|uniref:ADP/ATP translocase n=1 Tax=Euplotes crassus TaxID=5936 RepID=A0AAD1XL98_EUPCR|nr:unnamed protein product [Moneuplotes crassus]
MVALTSTVLSKSISTLNHAPISRAVLLLQCQNSSTQIKPENRYNGFNVFSRIYKEQGLLSFWRGNLPACLKTIPVFVLHRWFSVPLKNLFGLKDPNKAGMKKFLANLTAGGLAGTISLMISYPIEFCRVRMAMDVGATPKERMFNSYSHIWSKISNSEGLKGFYKGLPVSIIGIFAYRGLYFGLFDTFKTLVSQNFFMMWLFAQGTTMSAMILTYPLNTVKGRMMMQSGRKNPQYKNSFDSIKTIARKEGIRGFYGGLGVSLITSTGATIALMIYSSFDKK